MNENNTETAPKMSYDSSRSVISSARALRLGMPYLSGKAVFYAGDTVIGCEFAKDEAHAKSMLNTVQRAHASASISVVFVEPRVSPKELRGSTGRPKPYTPAKDKASKGGKKGKDQDAKKAA